MATKIQAARHSHPFRARGDGRSQWCPTRMLFRRILDGGDVGTLFLPIEPKPGLVGSDGSLSTNRLRAILIIDAGRQRKALIEDGKSLLPQSGLWGIRGFFEEGRSGQDWLTLRGRRGGSRPDKLCFRRCGACQRSANQPHSHDLG